VESTWSSSGVHQDYVEFTWSSAGVHQDYQDFTPDGLHEDLQGSVTNSTWLPHWIGWSLRCSAPYIPIHQVLAKPHVLLRPFLQLSEYMCLKSLLICFYSRWERPQSGGQMVPFGLWLKTVCIHTLAATGNESFCNGPQPKVGWFRNTFPRRPIRSSTV